MKKSHFIVWAGGTLAVLAVVLVARLLNLAAFFAPLWLSALLLLPVVAWVAAKGRSGLPSRTNALSLFVRTMVLVLLVLCLADVQIVRRNNGLSVLFLMDHSASVPEGITKKELEYVNAAAATKGRKDTAGIVAFGENASVEIMPAKDLKVERIYSCVDRNYTDIQGALELATAAFPADTRKKIVLITDGNENKGSLMDGIKFAAGNRVTTDILPVSYDYKKEVMIEKIHIPDRVRENETFDMRVSIMSLQECPAELAIYRNGILVAREPLNLKKGREFYASSMKIEEPGFYTFTARISSAADTVAENNEASGYVYIQGASRTLFVAPTELEARYLAKACREENIETEIVSPQSLPDSLGALQDYDCICLVNVPADELSGNSMAMLQANVRDLGAGLIMIGGENSFGAGGYEQTPIEEALPVTMDIKQKKINPKGALVLVLHTCEFPDGNYWAKQISKKAIDILNSQDEIGVLIYEGQGEQWLFGLRPAEDKKFMHEKIDGCSPGDMPSFAPTIKLAYDALSESDAMVRHIIIISDGDPAAPSPQQVKDVASAGITISTVGINPHSPRDVDVLKYLAYETGGRYYFADDPGILPRIFVKEAKVVKRSLIFNKKFQPLLVVSSEITKGIKENEIPPLMAYVATTAKPRAVVPMVSDNENADPVLAYWRYGLGKAAAFTSDATANWGKEWLEWDKFAKLWSQTIRWAARRREKTDLRIRTETEGGRGKLIIDAIDQQGNYINFLKLNGRIVGPDSKGAALAVRQTAPGRYEADFEARQTGVSIVNVAYQNPQTGGQGFVAAGVSVPFSPEFRNLESNVAALQQAAAAGGGRILSGNPRTDRVFTSSLPPSFSFQPIWERLLSVALLLFFLDVILRRVIVTRDDILALRAAVAARLPWRHRAAERDRTMESLLIRKKKTFEKIRPPAVPVDQGFKHALDHAAERQNRGEQASVDTAAGPVLPAERVEKESGREDRPAGEAPKPEAADSYTGRLLAAKKRAKTTKTDG